MASRDLAIMLDIKFGPNRRFVWTSGVKWQRLGRNRLNRLKKDEVWNPSQWVSQHPASIFNPCQFPSQHLSLCSSLCTTSSYRVPCDSHSQTTAGKENCQVSAAFELHTPSLVCWHFSLVVQSGIQGEKWRHETAVLTIN